MGNSDLSRIEKQLRQLKRSVLVIQQQLDIVDAEVRLSLSTALEENQLLLFRADPYSCDGTALADVEEF